MAIYPAGFIPNGSDDDSILLDCAMSSATNITDNSGTLQSGATVSADGAVSGSAGAVQFDLSAVDYGSLDVAGQIFFDVTTYDIGELHTSVGSEGFDRTTNGYLIHFNDADGVTPPYGRILTNANEQVQFERDTDDANDAVAGPHTLGAGVKTRIGMSWIGSVTTHYINGYPVQTKTRVGTTADKCRYIMLGALLNGTSPMESATTFSNILVSNRPVMMPSHPQLNNVIFWGDSFVTNAAIAVSTTYYHCTAENTFKRYLADRGINATLVIDGNSGYEIWDGATNDLESVRAALLAQDPQVVCIQAGTNDAVRNPIQAAFEADYQDHITTIMAHDTVERVIIGTIPTLKGNSTYDTPTYVSNVKTLNDIIRSLPVWWDTNNPSNTGKVTIADTFTALGSEEPYDNVFIGQIQNLFNDYHPSAKGQRLMGETFAAAILDVLQ